MTEPQFYLPCGCLGCLGLFSRCLEFVGLLGLDFSDLNHYGKGLVLASLIMLYQFVL